MNTYIKEHHRTAASVGTAILSQNFRWRLLQNITFINNYGGVVLWKFINPVIKREVPTLLNEINFRISSLSASSSNDVFFSESIQPYSR